MTQKQEEYIKFIEEFSGVKFTGDPTNEVDISTYITTYRDLAYSSNWALSHGYNN